MTSRSPIGWRNAPPCGRGFLGRLFHPARQTRGSASRQIRSMNTASTNLRIAFGDSGIKPKRIENHSPMAGEDAAELKRELGRADFLTMLIERQFTLVSANYKRRRKVGLVVRNSRNPQQAAVSAQTPPSARAASDQRRMLIVSRPDSREQKVRPLLNLPASTSLKDHPVSVYVLDLVARRA